MKLGSDVRTFDGETVIERTQLPNGILKIALTKPGHDDDRDSGFRHTYRIGKASFSIKKGIQI